MHLLIATGGSEHSKVALQLAGHILQQQPNKITPTILAVIKNQVDRLQAEKVLAEAGELLQPLTPQLQTKIRVGHRAKEIIAEAQAGGYELVIMGKRPSHRLKTRFLGSTATQVMEYAPCPVIIAKGHPQPINRILLCDSGAQSPSLLNRFVDNVAYMFSNRLDVTVLHVMSQISAGPGVSGRQLRAGADELIQAHAPEGKLLIQDIEMLQQSNVRALPKVRHGMVVDEILTEAHTGNYDLVVIGTYRHEGSWSFLLENLARQIVAQIDRAVLVLR